MIANKKFTHLAKSKIKQRKTEDVINISDPRKFIIIKGVRVHNLKNVNIDIQKNKLIVFTGVSGSGKSSLVFDTIYAEGQRRYVESLSSYARQFLERINKPDLDFIAGLAPSMAIEQKTKIKNPRSTVGTTTEIYDYLRLLFARIGKTYSPVSGKLVRKDSPESIIDEITKVSGGKPVRLYVLTDHILKDETDLRFRINELKANGFYRLLMKDEIIDINEITENELINIIRTAEKDNENQELRITVLMDRLSFDPGDIESVTRFNDSIELAYRESEGYVTIRILSDKDYNDLYFNKYLELDGIRFEEPEPRLFSFNNPFGACAGQWILIWTWSFPIKENLFSTEPSVYFQHQNIHHI